MTFHEPVMPEEVQEYLAPAPGKKFIDATLGDAGHTIALLEKGAKVLGIEIFEPALQRAQERIQSLGLQENFLGVQGNFKDLENLTKNTEFEQVDGILFDLGYSSYQLDQNDSLGLSFLQDQSLDMRLDTSLQVTAADLLNSLPEKQIEKIIREYGGEKLARKFAAKIVEFRELKKFQTTKDLADLLKSAAPLGYERGRIHPATRTFQALRIVVNDELENLKQALPRAVPRLLPGGRMVVISFHSLEDRIAKSFGQGAQPSLKALTKKPLVPRPEEVAQNPRSRSAKMRVYERT